MKGLNNRFQKLSAEETKNIKGGLRYVTRSYSKFCQKRDSLQQQGKNMSINHTSDHYCIEW